MTMQIQDTCIYDGRKWDIENWHGNESVVPTNDELGIHTICVSMDNHSGRIDHYMVYRDRLYLMKIEVSLDPDFELVLPEGAHREVRCRFENMRRFDALGERTIVREHRFEYLVFHDLPIPYTGFLYLSGPYMDPWDLPLDADDDEVELVKIRLEFEDGVLVSVRPKCRESH